MLLQLTMAQGLMTCSRETNNVVVALTALPFIYNYTETGELQWVSRLADFKPITIIEGQTDDGRSQISYLSGEGGDKMRTLTPIFGPFVLVQVARTTPASAQAEMEYEELLTYIIDVTSGEGAYVGHSLPLIFTADENRLYTGHNHPFPMVRIYNID
jgi:hypothetical protein